MIFVGRRESAAFSDEIFQAKEISLEISQKRRRTQKKGDA